MPSPIIPALSKARFKGTGLIYLLLTTPFNTSISLLAVQYSQKYSHALSTKGEKAGATFISQSALLYNNCISPFEL